MRKTPVREIGMISFLFLSLVSTGFTLVTKPDPSTELIESKIIVRKLSNDLFQSNAYEIYDSAKLSQTGLDSAVFLKAITGFYNLKASGRVSDQSSILTIIDFKLSSTFKRMWIVDLKSKTLLLQTWVAHGEGSGLDLANSFSNDMSSYQSSLGFYLTDVIYSGKHGRSLKLIGLDEGFNDRAFARNIVLHAARYVSQRFIDENGHLGRSQGCPAVSPAVISDVINYIKGNTVIFANGNDSRYFSKFLDKDNAALYAFNGMNGLKEVSSEPTFNTQDRF